MSDSSGLTKCCAPNTRGRAPNRIRRTVSLNERPPYHMFGPTHTLITNNSYGTILYPCMYSHQITEPKRSTGLANNTGLVTSFAYLQQIDSSVVLFDGMNPTIFEYPNLISQISTRQILEGIVSLISCIEFGSTCRHFTRCACTCCLVW